MRSLVVTLLAGMCIPMPAAAQLSPDGGPVQITAAQLDVFEKENRAVYVGDVDVIQSTARLRADKLTINFKSSESGGGFSSPDTMVAEGDVFYVTPDLRARGDRGVYTSDTDTVLLTGNVILSRGEDIATGDCLTLRISAGQSTLGCGESDGTGRRVTTQITPANTPEPVTPEEDGA